MADDISMVYSDRRGNIFDFPGHPPLFRSGNRFVQVQKSDLIKLPYGSYLFTLPDRYPVSGKGGNNAAVKRSPHGEDINAVASFPASAYLRTYLPAFTAKKNAVTLPLWAYTGVVLKGDDFYIPDVRI